MAKDEKKQIIVKRGEDLKNSTIFVISFGALFCVILCYFGFTVKDAIGLAIAGFGIFAFSIICTLPNLIGYFRGKRRARLIKKGVIVDEQKKSFNPNNRWGDDDR